MRIYEFMEKLNKDIEVIIHTIREEYFWVGKANKFSKKIVANKEISYITIKNNKVVLYLI